MSAQEPKNIKKKRTYIKVNSEIKMQNGKKIESARGKQHQDYVVEKNALNAMDRYLADRQRTRDGE